MTIYEPKNYSDEGLAEHGERIAGRAALTLEQARHLVAEIRNAITPAAMAMGVTDEGRQLGAEEHEDVRRSIRRIVALAKALAEAARRGGA